mmetsp:Transcript_15421/g.51758  ORF Transcript_15421/g.51758 Transcript_15421/m.51758 type:complete len:217 (-) Transcript_15421:3557-4207(-)
MARGLRRSILFTASSLPWSTCRAWRKTSCRSCWSSAGGFCELTPSRGWKSSSSRRLGGRCRSTLCCRISRCSMRRSCTTRAEATEGEESFAFASLSTSSHREKSDRSTTTSSRSSTSMLCSGSSTPSPPGRQPRGLRGPVVGLGRSQGRWERGGRICWTSLRLRGITMRRSCCRSCRWWTSTRSALSSSPSSAGTRRRSASTRIGWGTCSSRRSTA